MKQGFLWIGFITYVFVFLFFIFMTLTNLQVLINFGLLLSLIYVSVLSLTFMTHQMQLDSLYRKLDQLQ